MSVDIHNSEGYDSIMMDKETHTEALLEPAPARLFLCGNITKWLYRCTYAPDSANPDSALGKCRAA